MDTTEGTAAADDALAKLHGAESALQRAQEHGDVAVLDALVHDEVLFVAPDGSVLDKAADLEAHRSGQLRLDEVIELHRAVRVVGGIAGTSCVRLHLRGTAGGERIEADVTYTRTWVLHDGGWRVIQAQGCIATAGD